MSSTSSIPVFIAPPSITKQLKVALDTAGWRDKNRLIARYNQLITSASEERGRPPGCDLSTHMAMALLPTLPFSRPASSQLLSLWDHCQQLDTSTLPRTLQDPALQKSIYLTWLNSSLFTTPRHLLVQTPYEKLKDNLTKFLTPYLKAWPPGDQISIDSLSVLLASIPQKWEHYSDFTLLPPSAFLAEPWPQVLKHLVQVDHTQPQKHSSALLIMEQLEKLVQDALGSSHIARKAIIPVQDILRRPKIRPLTGDWGIHNRFKSWIEHDQVGLLDHHTVQDQQQVEALTHAADAEPTTENFASAYWAMTCQNQVWYSWAPMFTMFSAGNITEKERVAHSRPIFDARDKIVVDLYAGIGYFTLVYLLHAGARTVHACEWNPWSVEGLARGADRNGIRWSKVSSLEDASASGQESPTISKHAQKTPKKSTKPTPPLGNLVIYPGDNAQWISCFENQAHHINLGLIPSAELGWVLGVRALCPKEGGYLHVHHNIRVGEEESFKAYLLQSLKLQFAEWKAGQDWELHIRHMENIKSFAPLVFHYVADVECRPKT
ncbi:hypothetical protein MVEG_08586 [Podila verticillata NRRL 6337]|nr:MAG: S-adenosyl-L-methionine-dependent methyltransferase [Podila humilis]KFH65105.1 hypothetical protein MVEG_08586 [Podila verticillata NRRL 6337]